LATRYGLNAKTVPKWRKRSSTSDRPMGPSRPKSTVLTEIEEAIVTEFRRRPAAAALCGGAKPGFEKLALILPSRDAKFD
jgi:hypothetical protein